jgi:EmrB/QacA subfamily drug resistance transporter
MKTEQLSLSGPVDFSRKWHAMAAVSTGVFLATVDGSIINVSLPAIAQSLHTEFAVVQWVVLAYLLTITCTMAGIGRLADMVGKKTIYMLGFVVFTAGSVLCGLASSVQWLIAFRVLQASGAAMTMALGAAIITEAFPPEERGRAMGIIGSVVSIGIAVGPALGGLILSVLTWHWIFYVNLPVGIAGTLMSLRYLPDIRPQGRQRFDFLGALTLCLSILMILLGLTLGQQQGFRQLPVYALLGSGAGLAAVFISIEKKVAQPMIDLSLFRHDVIGVNLTAGFISFVGLGGTIILLPFYLVNIMGFAPIKVGLLMGIIPVMLGLTSPLSGTLSDRIGSRRITIAGLVVMAAGFISASGLSLDVGVVGYGLRVFAIGAGIGIFISPNNSAIMGSAPRRHLGIVSGLMAQSRTLGQTVGVALIGAVWAGRTAHHSGVYAAGGVTAAPLQAQILGLHDAFVAAAVLIGIALLINVYTFIKDSR